MSMLGNFSIRPKLIALLLLVGMLPLAMTGWFTTRAADEALMDKAFGQLDTIVQSKQVRIESYIAERLTELETMAGEETTIATMEHFHHIFHDLDQQKLEIGGKQWEKAVNQRFVQRIEKYRKAHGYSDILFIDQDGFITYTAARESDLGSNVTHGDLKNSALHKLFNKAQTTKAIQDFEPYAPYGFRHASFLGAPIREDGQTVGILVFRLPTEPIDQIMSSRSGMGNTGETYLVGKHEGTISYRNNRVIKAGKIGQTKSSTYIDKALTGEQGHEVSPGSNGELELHSFRSLDLPGLNWAVIGSIDHDEVDDPIVKLGNYIFIIGCVLASLVVVAALFFARTIATPLQAINDAAGQISQGEWSARVAVKGSDELGQLATAFNQMAASNEEQFWVKSSLAELTKIIQLSESPEDFVTKMIRKLAPMLNCGHGAVYLLSERDHKYHLLAGYGFQERKNISNVFAPGEGMVGQCALEKEPILLTNVPGDHIKITTGLGESSPLCIMALPLLFKGQVLAVVELATYHLFTSGQKNLLNELIPTLGLGLENLNRNQRTTHLLGETQRQAKKLDAQGEEMRRANEELLLQREEIQQSNENLQLRNEEVRRANEELEEQSQSLLKSQEELRAQQEDLQKANQSLELTRQEVQRKADDLEVAGRYKSQFLANMSHELRTPLNSLLILARGFAENEDGNLTKDQVESANIILASGTDLLDLINDVLDLSKIEAGKMDLHITAVSVADFAENIRSQFKHMAVAKNLDWQVTVTDGAPERIDTDEGKVRQILKNFLSNAFKFTETGSVTVLLSPLPGNGLTISVADTGIGIAKDKHKLVFDAFQQADGGTSRKYGGTGLGLSIVQKLASLLGGEIRMSSEEGEGSVFSLLLPGDLTKIGGYDHIPLPAKRVKPSVSRVQTTAAPVTNAMFIEDDRNNLSSKDHLLLVIEDDAAFASIVLKQAHKGGFKCLATDMGASGLQLAIKHQPMGIILDRALPDMDGEDVLTKLKENPATRRIPVHIVTAMDRKQSLGKGAIGVLEKPVTRDQLKKIMETFECHATEKRSKLLLVEDDPNSSKVTATLLETSGIEVVAVDNCMDAMHLLRNDSFDCMILDLNLPDCGGFNLLEEITRDPLIKQPPVVIYSGKELSREEYNRLRQYTDALVTKGGAGSGERLAKEVGAFLQNMAAFTQDGSPTEIKDWKQIFENTCVMLVDDDVRNTFALSRALEKRGIHIIMAPDGQTALDLLQHSPRAVDAVLMDVMMPGMDGNEVTRKIRENENFQKLPIIGLSAKAMAEDQQRSLAAGMNHFLSKPVDLQHLLGRLRDIIAKKPTPVNSEGHDDS